ncbi:MAG TPA: tyrosine-type recombinase/integrase [Blastocatellia bacterium]|nr:tyrosine-type recombinase/integrase [Blastocatellia bacterium]
MELDDLFKNFLKEKRYLQNVSDWTIDFYERSYKAYKRILGPKEPTTELLKEFVIGLKMSGISTQSVNCYIRGINSFLSWLHESGYTPEKLRIKQLPSEKKGKPTYSEQHLKAILTWKPSTWTQWRLYGILCTLIDVGARIDEVLTLQRSKINFDDLLIPLKGKGNKERIVPISPELRKILYRWLKKHDFPLVFPTRDGVKLLHRNVLRDYQILCNKLGLESKGFHVFRHTFAYQYAKTIALLTGDARNGIMHLQRQLGHESLATTRIYVDILTEDLTLMHQKTSAHVFFDCERDSMKHIR